MGETMKKIRFVLVAGAALLCLGRSIECEAGAYAYVANHKDPNIRAIKVPNPAGVEPEIYVLGANLKGNLLGVAITPGGEVYVANPEVDAVYVIDTDGHVHAIEEIGKKPTGVAASPTGDYVYVANRDDGSDGGTVSIIDTLTRTEKTKPKTRIRVGTDPIGVAVSPDGDYICVANRESESVSVIDASTGGILSTIEDIGEKPVGVAVSPEGDYVYVTNRGDGTVSVIDTSSWEEVTALYTRPNVGTAPIGVAVSPDGSLVYVASLDIDGGGGAVFVIDTSAAPDDFEVVDRIKPVGERPVGVALTPNGDYLVVTNREDSSSNGTVSVIRVSDRQLIDTREDVGKRPASFGQFVGGVSVPDAPSDLAATIESDSQINLAWADESSDESGFKIERRGESEETYTEIASVESNVTTYSDTDLEPDTTYRYRVRAYNDHGDSDYSNETEAETAPIPILKAPTNLTATDTSDSRIRLSWTDNSYGELGVEIERMTVSEDADSDTDTEDSGQTNNATVATGFTKIAEVGANVTSYSDGGLEPYTTYRYRVQAFDAASAVSGWSNEAETRTDDDCFIATAAYGSLMEPHVVTLRHFRDTCLVPHTLGRVFVRTYYQYSPPIADFISKHETLRAAVRLGLLPLVAFSHSMLHLGPTLTFTILVFVALSPGGLHRLCQRKRRSHKAGV
jgi:YVTN family beta-propeller protein